MDQWSGWSGCSETCGTGQRRRSRGGEAEGCEKVDTEKCVGVQCDDPLGRNRNITIYYIDDIFGLHRVT